MNTADPSPDLPAAPARSLARERTGDSASSPARRAASALTPSDGTTEPATPPLERIGDFEIVRQLGRGASGIVYEARQISLGRRLVALKVLPLVPALGALGAQHIERFQREAESGARLSHPNLVTVHGLGEADGVHYIVQELVEGGRTLADWIEDSRAGAEQGGSPAYYRSVAEMFARVADALHVVHAAGLVHRDVKPRNILLTRDGEPKLGDFGLALDREAFTLTESGQVPGTPAYMSPEQARADGRAVDARSDLFALGATLYEALTFLRPFYGQSLMQVLDSILRTEPLDPRAIRARVPRDLSVICLKSLEKTPKLRYQSAQEFAADLRRFLANEPIYARPAGPVQRAVKWSRRHPTIAATGALLVVALAVVSALLVDVVRTQLRLERYTDRGQALALRESAAELDEPREELVPRLESWLAEAQTLATKLSQHEEEYARTNDAGLVDLIASMKLLGESADRDSIAGVTRRLERLRDLRRQSLEAVAPEWSDVCANIADETRSPEYRGLRLEPQLGLVPLRRDPESRLFEFLHVLSGAAPTLDAENRWVIVEDTGLVLVLIPGGPATIGAVRDDESAPNHDPNAKDVELPAFRVGVAPYFLSKYEMTQAQWTRFTGRNPSKYSRGLEHVGPTNPVESVDWFEADDTLRRMGLTSPTEIQWEHAARGGRPGRFGCGADIACLQGSANLADMAHEQGTKQVSPVTWSDGFTLHAPVGSLAANGYGLHDAIGNVMEWCGNAFGRYPLAGDAVRPPRGPALRAGLYPARGGAYDGVPGEFGRVSQRIALAPELKSANIGVRPARGIDL